MIVLKIIGSFYIRMLYADSPSIPEIAKHIAHTFLKLLNYSTSTFLFCLLITTYSFCGYFIVKDESSVKIAVFD